jgi:hypothetical protein
MATANAFHDADGLKIIDSLSFSVCIFEIGDIILYGRSIHAKHEYICHRSYSYITADYTGPISISSRPIGLFLLL